MSCHVMSSYNLIFAAQDLQRNCDRWDSKAEPSLLDQSSLDGDDRGLFEKFFFLLDLEFFFCHLPGEGL